METVNFQAIHKPLLDVETDDNIIIKAFDFYMKQHLGDLYNSGKINMLECVDNFLEFLEIKTFVDPISLKYIPEQGPFAIVVNHCLPGLDSLLLYSQIAKIRPDFQVVNNISNCNTVFAKDIFFTPNVFQNSFDNQLKLFAEQYIIEHLEHACLGFFPAASTYKKTNNSKSKDNVWSVEIISAIKASNVPVVPVYFSSKKGLRNFVTRKLHGLLLKKNMQLPALQQTFDTVFMSIGSKVLVKEQLSFDTNFSLTRYLRAATYMLGHEKVQVKSFFRSLPSYKRVTQSEVAPPANTEIMQKEIDALCDNERLFSFKQFEVFCASAVRIPETLTEIGRLRELSFRSVGEGTNNSIDLDEYDLYYEHLFIWDTECKKIVGAYRIGLGNEILQQYGKKGFYIHSLFKIKDEFIPNLTQSLELGRSFIAVEYQKQYASLFLLWRGILYFLLKNEDYRFLIGPVSISNSFSYLSKSLIISFVESHYFEHNAARFIKPRKKFKIPKSIVADVQDLITNIDISKLDKQIEEIEKNMKLPVLLKKYLSLNAKIASFNIDPKFNDCLDGLIFLDIFNIPYDNIKAISKDLEDTQILERFQKV